MRRILRAVWQFHVQLVAFDLGCDVAMLQELLATDRLSLIWEGRQIGHKGRPRRPRPAEVGTELERKESKMGRRSKAD